jgi:putative flavoprotein involved in K+ transport
MSTVNVARSGSLVFISEGARMPHAYVETLIIGAGQAGLAMSHMLSRRGCSHLVLERGRIAERWRTERWDDLRFQFPNWSIRLPDFSFPHSNPDAFATSREILDFICAYADFIGAPVRCGVSVTGLREGGLGFVAETSDGVLEATNVVIATGPYQRPKIPALLQDDGRFFQVHASGYTRPDQLPRGATLVVGSGASGAQIAEELMRAGRRVYLSVGRHRRMPRRYRGRDLMWWLSALGLDKTPTERRGPERALPLITGAYGGHTIDFRRFASQGIVLLGRVVADRDGTLDIAPNLAESLSYGDAAYVNFLDMADAHASRHRLNLPEDQSARVAERDPPCLVEPLRHLDLHAAGVTSVIWATGYDVDFGWLQIPVFDPHGCPVHRSGITDVPGLYFLGLPWLSKMNSSFLSGVGDDATRLADHIAARHCSPGTLAPNRACIA